MNKDQVVGVITSVLTFAGGILVTKGLVDNTTLTTAIAAIGTLVGVGWQIMHHSK